MYRRDVYYIFYNHVLFENLAIFVDHKFAKRKKEHTSAESRLRGVVLRVTKRTKGVIRR